MFFYVQPDPNIRLTLSVNTSSILFNNTYINEVSQSTFAVTAISGNVIETITLSDNTNQYSFSPDSFLLSITGSQIVTVTFSPTNTGSLYGLLSITSSGGSGKYVSLTGSSTHRPLTLSMSTSSLLFSDTYVSESADMLINVSASSGTATEIITLSDNTNQYSFSPSNFSLSGSDMSSITITFSPTSLGFKSGLLTLSSSGGDIKYLPLSGTGIWRSVGASGGITSSINV